MTARRTATAWHDMAQGDVPGKMEEGEFYAIETFGSTGEPAQYPVSTRSAYGLGQLVHVECRAVSVARCTQRHRFPCRAMLDVARAMPCHAVPCHAMPYCAMPYRAVPCPGAR